LRAYSQPILLEDEGTMREEVRGGVGRESLETNLKRSVRQRLFNQLFIHKE
jgi:hypothetical protein